MKDFFQQFPMNGPGSKLHLNIGVFSNYRLCQQRIQGSPIKAYAKNHMVPID